MKIMANFDQAIAQILSEKVKARMSFKVLHDSQSLHLKRFSLVAQGHLDTYRFCDEVWTFIIKDIKFKLDNSQTIEAEKVKIVSCAWKDKP